MQQQLDLARKKTVMLSAGLGIWCMMLLVLPPIAVRHGIPTVWIVLPQCLVAVILMVSIILSASEFLAHHRRKGRNGQQ